MIDKNLKELLRGWNESNDAAKYRNEIRRRSREEGLSLEDYIETIFAGQPAEIEPSRSEEGERTELSALAQKMIDSGWVCENMDNPEEALDYLYLAAEENLRREDLIEPAQRFWSAAEKNWKLWKIRKRRSQQ